MSFKIRPIHRLLYFVALFSAFSLGALAESAAEDSGAERVSVDALKKKYWARGDETEMGVVQNRLYSKDQRFQLGVFAGVNATDPFLSVQNWGFNLGYHFNEYFSLHALFYKMMVGPSSALRTFEQTIGATTNINPPYWYLGGEAAGSLMYGKLSLLGKAIIYYDFHLLANAGATATENGTFFTVGGGVGQQIYLTRTISLSVDYRIMHYEETIREKVVLKRLGEVIGTRSNWNNVVTVGVNFLVNFWGPSSSTAPAAAPAGDASRDPASAGYSSRRGGLR